MTDEKHLVQASLAGDSRSFERLVEKYQAMICAITFAATGRVETSEELAQETFLRAWKNLAQLKEIEKFRFWLCSITRNLLRTYYQQKQADKVSVCDDDTLETLASQHIQSPADTLISQEEEMILSQALMQIPEEYREPLVLYYRQQQSTKEVAESLDLNEATVRTRLSRGRQMLKDQVATMVERTLEKTGPSKKFTKAVMVSIGAGLAAGTAATAGMAATGASISTTTTTGILTAAGAKVAAIAAAVILTAGVAIYSYSKSQEKISQQQPIQQQLPTETTPQTPIIVKQETIKSQPTPQQTPEMPVVIEKKPDPQPQTSKVRHPDWPGINEPIKYVHVETKLTGIDGTEGTEGVQKLWARLPDAFRDEGQFNKITIDNGKQRLVLDPNTKQAQIEPTWYKDGKMIWQFQQTLEEHPMMEMVKLFRDPNSNPKIVLTKLTTDNNELTTAYNFKDNEMSDPNGIQIKIWVDNRTQLPEKAEALVIGEPNQFDNIQSGMIVFDYTPISDAMFSIDIPVEYKTLPTKQPKGFSGRVIDLSGNPVANAEIYLHNWTLGKRSPYKTTSDQNGNFNVILPQYEYGFNSPIALWAKLPDNPAFIGWTLLLCPQDQDKLDDEKKRGFPLGGIIPGSPGVVYYSDGGLCIAVSDIILVMEPANKVFGWIHDTQGNIVSNATINVSLGSLANQHGYESQIRLENPKDLFVTQTNQQGYYEIGGIPKLWKKCKYGITVTPQNDGRVGDSRTIVIDDPNQPIQVDFILLSQGPTVRGIVVDNYGTPLSERYVNVQVNKKSFPGYSTKTDKNGRFEFKHCPADTGLQIKAELSYNNYMQGIAYIYYPDVTVDVGYQPGQDEYEVKLVAIKPELEIEATLTDSAGNPLPYFPVEIRADDSLPTQWQVERGFHERTNENGRIKFVNAPEMKGLRLECSFVLEPLSDQSQTPQMQQYLKELGETYKKYRWTEAEVPLEPGKKKYQMTITIPTEEEYKQQKIDQEK
jgi:RNA polymerase sigma factor (sigma-70 family)